MSGVFLSSSGITGLRSGGLAISNVVAALAPDISAHTYSMTTGYTNGQTIATVAVDNSPYPTSLTWSITAGNSDGAFAIGSSTGVLTVADATKLAAGDRVITVQATNTAGSDTAAITASITSATDADITVVTLTNAAASSITNEIVEFGIPLAATSVGSGQYLRLYDDDGVGGRGSAIGFQIDNISTDLNSATRMAKVTGIVPALGSSATRKLRVGSSNTSVPTGTAIATSDILATSARWVVTTTIGGTAYTVDSSDLLAASTTFSKSAAWKSAHKWRDGPFCTEFVLRSPVMNGGTAHASGDGLHVEMHIAAFKAGSGAVSGGNPIIAVRADIQLQNGDAARGTASNYYYGLKIERATSLTVGTLIATDDTDADGNTIRYQWDSKQPAATLTLSAATSGLRTATLSTGSWDADIKGAHIVNPSGAGKAYVYSRTSSTVAAIFIYEDFTTTSYTSTNWTQEAIGHPYNTDERIRSWIGQKPKSIAAWGDNSSAVTPTTKAPLDYLVSTKMALNHALTFAGVTHDMTDLNAMVSTGNVRRPFTQAASTVLGDVRIGIGGTGGRPDIGYQPGWNVRGLTKCDANGRRKIFENAQYFAYWNYRMPRRLSGSPSAGSLPATPRADNGTTYKWGTTYQGTEIVVPATQIIPWDKDANHHPAAHYMPYLMTGDLFWLQQMQSVEAFSSWLFINNSYGGSGANKTAFGDALGVNTEPFNDSNTRGKAWAARDTIQTCICTPDSARDTLFNAKSYYTTRVANTWTALKKYGPDDVLGIYGAREPIWIHTAQLTNGSYTIENESPYQMFFCDVMIGHAYELGLSNSTLNSGRDWLAKLITVFPADANVVKDITTPAYRYLLKDNDQNTSFMSTWAAVYKQAALNAARNTSELGDYIRTPSGTVSLSTNTAAASATITFSGSYFGAGSYYNNGYIGDGTGLAKITTVTDAQHVTATIITPFASTTPSAATVQLPGPAPSDYTGYASAISGANDYHQGFAMSARLLEDQGVSGAATQRAYMTGRTSYAESNDWWSIKSRVSGL